MNNDTQTQLIFGQQPIINNTGIDMTALLEEWRFSKNYVEQYTRDFKQLDDLVDGVPLNKDSNSPFVGDTTLPGLVRSIPRDSLQQLPVYSVRVNGTKLSIPAIICTYLLKKFAFNEDTFGKGLLSTLQVGAEQALAHGYAAFMVGTGLLFNDFGTTLRLLHFTDTSPEPGIQDHNETGYDFVTGHPTPGRVRRILRAALKNPNTSWSVEGLKRVLDASAKPTAYSIWESMARQNNPGEQSGPTYEFVTRYETGPDASIVTFCPDVSDVPLRVLDNKSKWGYPRVMYLVIDPAPLTPFGVSRVRLASPNQNLMNIYYANIASMLLLNSKPPILKRGRFLKPVALKQGAVWETMDTNADAKLVTIDNGALEQFVGMAQQFAGQIQNIMGGQSMQVGPAGKNNFGKTGPGVKAATNVMDVNTNQVTKILENFLRQYSLVALDTLFCEQEGVDNIIVDDETKENINRIHPGFVGDDNKIIMDWKRFYDAIEEWGVNIDVSLSKDEFDDQKRSEIQDALTVMSQTADPADPVAQARKTALENELLQDTVPEIASITPSGPFAPSAAVIPQQPAPAGV